MKVARYGRKEIRVSATCVVLAVGKLFLRKRSRLLELIGSSIVAVPAEHGYYEPFVHQLGVWGKIVKHGRMSSRRR